MSGLFHRPAVHGFNNHSLGPERLTNVEQRGRSCGAYAYCLGLLVPFVLAEAAIACGMKDREHRLLVLGHLRLCVGSGFANLGRLNDA
jgi:hypothetical protein